MDYCVYDTFVLKEGSRGLQHQVKGRIERNLELSIHIIRIPINREEFELLDDNNPTKVALQLKNLNVHFSDSEVEMKS